MAATKVQRADGAGPFVEITQVGRWTYSLSGVIDGIGVWVRMDGDRVWGSAPRRTAGVETAGAVPP